MKFSIISAFSALFILTSCSKPVEPTPSPIPSATPTPSLIITSPSPIPSPDSTPSQNVPPSSSSPDSENQDAVDTFAETTQQSPDSTPSPEESFTPLAEDPDWPSVDTPLNYGQLENVMYAVHEVQLEEAALTIQVVPNPEGSNFQSFIASEVRSPLVAVDFDTEHQALCIVLYHTTLTSADPALEGGGNDDWVFDFIAEQEYQFPTQVATGSLGENTTYYQNPAIFSDGQHTYITLVLPETTTHYHVYSDFADGDLRGWPQIHIDLRGSQPLEDPLSHETPPDEEPSPNSSS